MVNRWCKGCKTGRNFNIFDVYNKKKKRVVCGWCGTILMEELEIQQTYYQYNDCCC